MLDFCHDFACKNEFDFNSTKCKILKLFKKCEKPVCKSCILKLGNSVLEVVETYKYLGIEFGRGLHPGSRPAPFADYLDRISTKAAARCMVVYYLGARRDGLRP